MMRIARVIVVAMLIAGCSEPLTTREKGALVGGAVGAGTGALVGNAVGHPGAGALIGAGVGVVGGAVVGDAMQSAERKQAAAPPPPQVVPPPPVVVAPPPPPPQVVVASPPPIVVTQAPRYVWVPDWGVYVMEGHDVVYHERAHYYYHGGRWWVAQAYTGPWVVVGSPPPTIVRLPHGGLHQHMTRFCPRGQAKKGRC